jgi:hypothetical protein
MPEKDPFVIPFCLWGKPTGIEAHLYVMTADRVCGSVVQRHGRLEVKTPFNVKHNGKVFSVGSGSAKQRFYFYNWSK